MISWPTQPQPRRKAAAKSYGHETRVMRPGRQAVSTTVYYTLIRGAESWRVTERQMTRLLGDGANWMPAQNGSPAAVPT